MTGKHAGGPCGTADLADGAPQCAADAPPASVRGHSVPARSRETTMMTTIGTRPYPDDGAAVIGRAATMPPVTGPGRPGRASRALLHLTVAAAGGLLAAGMIAARPQPRPPAPRTAPCTASRRTGGTRPDTAPPANPAPRPAPAAEQVRAGVVLSRFTRRHLPIYPVWSTTMPANTRSPQSRPHGAPACHLAPTASLRVTTAGRQPQQRLTHRTGKSRS